MPNIKAEMTEQQMAAQLEARVRHMCVARAHEKKRRKLELDRKAREVCLSLAHLISFNARHSHDSADASRIAFATTLS